MWKPSSWMNLTKLLDDSQIHFVEKITHYAPRDHQLIYMSATTKFDQDKIAPTRA